MEATANSNEKRACLWCSEHILDGRSDKIFCNLNCKNAFNNERNKDKNLVFRQTDKYLHSNWEILARLYSLSKGDKYIDPLLLTTKAFRPAYITGSDTQSIPSVVKYLVYNYAFVFNEKSGVLIFKENHYCPTNFSS